MDNKIEFEATLYAVDKEQDFPCKPLDIFRLVSTKGSIDPMTITQKVHFHKRVKITLENTGVDSEWVTNPNPLERTGLEVFPARAKHGGSDT